MSCVRITQVALAAVLALAAATRGQPAGHGHHPPMPDQKFVVECRFQQDGRMRRIETPIRLASPTMPARPEQTINLPEPYAPLYVQQYLPQGLLHQNVVPGDTGEGKPAIHLSIEGPTQSHRRWLIADDAERNRLTSLVGTWRYMAAEDRAQRDDLFRQFQDELSRDPKLQVSKPNGESLVALLAKEGQATEIAGMGCTLKVLRFEPDFALDRASGKAVNRSDHRLNPAALVEIETGGKRTEHWVFARYPEFSMKGDGGPPVRIVLDCPIESEDPVAAFAIVTIGRSEHELWRRYHGISSTPLSVDEKREIPDSRYTFRISEFIPVGRLVEAYRPAVGRGGVPALELGVTGAGGNAESVWLESGKQRVVHTPHGMVTIGFGPQINPSGGGHP